MRRDARIAKLALKREARAKRRAARYPKPNFVRAKTIYGTEWSCRFDPETKTFHLKHKPYTFSRREIISWTEESLPRKLRYCFDDEEEYYANKEREKELYEEMEREMYEEMEKEYQAKTEQVASDADEPCEYCAEHGTMVCPDCITQDEQDSIR